MRFGIEPGVEVRSSKPAVGEGGSYDRVAEGGNPVEDRMEVSSKRRGEPGLRDGWAIQVGRRQPRAGAAGRLGLTAAKCRTRPCHEGRDGGLRANSEAASVSNGKGGAKRR